MQHHAQWIWSQSYSDQPYIIYNEKMITINIWLSLRIKISTNLEERHKEGEQNKIST